MKIHASAFGCAALLGLLAIALPQALGASAPPRVRTTVQEVSEGLTCQCGCGLTVANCNHPTCSFSVPMRGQIEQMIKGGMARPQIISFFRGKYGEKVLSAPTTEGFNILAWIAPFAALLIGAIFIVFEAGRWRSRAAARKKTSSYSATDFDPRLRRILERELHERI